MKNTVRVPLGALNYGSEDPHYLPGSLTYGQNKPDTQDVAAIGWIIPESVSRADEIRFVKPTATANDTERTRIRALWIICWTSIVVKTVVPV